MSNNTKHVFILSFSILNEWFCSCIHVSSNSNMEKGRSRESTSPQTLTQRKLFQLCKTAPAVTLHLSLLGQERLPVALVVQWQSIITDVSASLSLALFSFFTGLKLRSHHLKVLLFFSLTMTSTLYHKIKELTGLAFKKHPFIFHGIWGKTVLGWNTNQIFVLFFKVLN